MVDPKMIIEGEFSQLQGISYLDMAALGIAPASVRARVQQQLSDYMALGTSAPEVFRPDDIIRNADAQVRKFLGAKDGHSFIGATATSVADAVLQAMPAGQGAILYCAEDYPGLVTLAERYARRNGQDVRLVPGNIYCASDLLGQIDASTAVVLVSHVHWITGAVMDLDALIEARRIHGFTLIVDASQAMPILPTEEQIGEIDLLVSVAHKWFCGAPGAALAHLSRRLLERIGPALESELWPVVPSNQSYTSMFVLGQMIDWFGDFGLEQMRDRTLRAAQTLREGAIEAGWKLIPGSDAIQQSGIVNLSLPEAKAISLSTRLREQNIYLSARGDGLRLSPHFAITRDDIDHALATLTAAARELQLHQKGNLL